MCDDLTCINFASRCDGRQDCPDGSDEDKCPGIQGVNKKIDPSLKNLTPLIDRVFNIFDLKSEK